MSGRSKREQGGDERDLGAIPERPALRRGLFGYRREDVDQAFEARDGELAELRQDVAALWLAFAQHDRLIRAAMQSPGSFAAPLQPAAPAKPAVAAPTPVAPPTPEPATPAAAAPVPAAAPSPDGSSAPISRQLEELDQVLAAIESATQTLERTYGEESEATAPDPARGDAAREH